MCQNPLVARLVFGFSFYSNTDAQTCPATSVLTDTDFGPAEISPKTPWEDRYQAACKEFGFCCLLVFSFFSPFSNIIKKQGQFIEQISFKHSILSDYNALWSVWQAGVGRGEPY